MGARYVQNGQLSVFPSLDESRHRLAAVAGTSTCHLVQVIKTFPDIHIALLIVSQSKEGIFVKGVWGPYKANDLFSKDNYADSLQRMQHSKVGG